MGVAVGYHISADDRLVTKALVRLKRGRRAKEQEVVTHGLPSRKFACIRKKFSKYEAESELWMLWKTAPKSRWTMVFCEPCSGWHVMREKWPDE